MLMNSVLHNFSLRSDSVGRLAAVMASVYDLSWKMNRIARLWMYSICFVCFFCKSRVPYVAYVLQYRSDD